MNTKKILNYMLVNCLAIMISFPLFAQKTDMNYDEIESKQDEIENLYVDIYKIIDEYPAVTYNYVYDDGEITEVAITGIENNYDKKALEVLLLDLDQLKNELTNYSNRVGVFYATEEEPRPKEGYRAFYQNLYTNITYPESATDNEVEGTVFVKFVVDHEGNVENVIASEKIEAPYEAIVKDMEKEAKMAVKKTSGDWIPAKIGGISVAQWVVLPVQFKIEARPFSRSL